MDSETLDRIIEHDISYASMEDEIIRTPAAWYAAAPSISIYQSANRAVRVRINDSGPASTALEVVTFFKDRNMRPVVEMDAVSEEQGVGRELRRMGITPVVGDTIWMRYPRKAILNEWNSDIKIYRINSLNENLERNEWIRTALSEDIGTPEEDQWRKVLLREAFRPQTTLFLAKLDGVAAGVCDLFSRDGWGRIDCVVTLPEFRRKGVASALVSRAIRESVALENKVTYLCTETGSAAESLYFRIGFESWGVNILRRHMG